MLDLPLMLLDAGIEQIDKNSDPETHQPAGTTPLGGSLPGFAKNVNHLISKITVKSLGINDKHPAINRLRTPESQLLPEHSTSSESASRFSICPYQL